MAWGPSVPDARRAWAEALYAALPDDQARSKAALALEEAAHTLKDTRVDAFFRDPAVPKTSRAQVLSSLYADAGADPSSLAVFSRFAALLLEKGGVQLLPAVAAVFRARLDKELGLVRLELSSARPLPPAVLRRIEEAWKASSGATAVLIHESLNPSLMGGFILRTGSVRYDWSTAGRLKRLGRVLSLPLLEGRD